MNALINGFLTIRLIIVGSLLTGFLLLTACTPSLNTEPTLLPEPGEESQQKSGCNFSDLTGYVHAENNINAVQGVIVLSNYSENECVIGSIWEISIVDSNKDPIIFTSINMVNTNINSDHFLSIDFIWENYCQQNSPGAFDIKITENKTQQTVHIPIEDPNGNLISSPPACKDHNQEQSFLLQISQ